MNRSVLLVSICVIALVTSAFAGRAQEFDASYREMYAAYRKALFTTNSGKEQESRNAMATLGSRWAAIVSSYEQTPPPQFSSDDQWDETLASVSGTIDNALQQVDSGMLPAAHLTLEALRDELGLLHQRNDVETHSDRMNAYHAQMERLLEMDLSTMDPQKIQEILERAAVMSYLARDIVSRPPPEAEASAEYATLVSAFEQSVQDVLAAARRGEATALRAAISKLKMPYSRLFLNFG